MAAELVEMPIRAESLGDSPDHDAFFAGLQPIVARVLPRNRKFGFGD
jgi:hypothetical protein